MKTRQTTTLVLGILLVFGFSACKKASEPKSEKSTQVMNEVSFKCPLSKEEAIKGVAEANKKGKAKKAGAFRQDEIANASSNTLAFIAGGNFAEMSVGILVQDEKMINNAYNGLVELSKRGATVGSWNWVDAVNALNRDISSKTIDSSEAAIRFSKIGTTMVTEAKKSGQMEFSHNVLMGMSVYMAGVSLLAGKKEIAINYSKGMKDYLSIYEARVSKDGLDTLKGAIASLDKEMSIEEQKVVGLVFIASASIISIN